MRKQIDSISLVLFALAFLTSCSIGQKPINYGEVACNYCSMTIVDKQHAAQIVTDKGKVFNYDAAECMLNELNENDAPTVAIYMVNDYNNPGELMDATKSAYLISEGIPSPMGEFLTGFRTQEEALAAHTIHGGDLYNWVSLIEKFKK
ncbi:MAG: copper chaperone NosL [Cryomorphaceae bacterium]|jgi:copper chaperone NosL